MAEFPTKKQELVAKAINEATGRPLPEYRTKDEYAHYIKANINAYKREMQRYGVL